MAIPNTAFADGRNHEALLDALERLERDSPEYDGFLANHGPMAAEALIQMGEAEHVSSWVEHYRSRLEPRPPFGNTVTTSTWRDCLGDIRKLGDWNQFFQHAADETHWTDLLGTWWPRLLPGAAASATHGLIRTAHAVRALATTPTPDTLLVHELADGLAYWAARFQFLPGDPALAGQLDAVEAVARLPRLDPDIPSTGPGISGRLASLIRLRELPDALDTFGMRAAPSAALDELIAAAAMLVVERDDAPIAFCHAVTAPAAVQLVLPHLPLELHRPSVAASWQIVAAIVASYAWPRGKDRPRTDHDEAPVPGELVPKAVAHGDEHVIKLTEATIRQFARTDDPVLLVAAERFRHRIQPLW